jgi:hypothetical protein
MRLHDLNQKGVKFIGLTFLPAKALEANSMGKGPF